MAEDEPLREAAYEPGERVVRIARRSAAARRCVSQLHALGTGSCLSWALIALSACALEASGAASIALIPWLHAAASRRALPRIVSGFCIGTASSLVAVWWIPEAIGSLGSDASAPVRLGVAVGICALVAGVPYAGLGAAAWGGGKAFVARVGLGVFVIDWLRSTALPLPAWGLLGHLEADLGVAQLARLGGVPLVSAAIAASSASIVTCMQPERSSASRGAAMTLVGAYCALCLAAEPALRAAAHCESAIRSLVLVVQPFVPPEERFHPDLQAMHLASLERMTADALAGSSSVPDLVVWPESSLFVSQNERGTAIRGIEMATARFETMLVAGIAEEAATNGDYRNTAIWVDPNRGILHETAKARAIPILEARTPLATNTGAVLLGFPRDRPLVVYGSGEPGAGGIAGFGAALCFEMFFPQVVDERAGGADRGIVNLASDSWNVRDAARAQQLRFARFRAIEQRLPVARASHGGGSAIIDAFGDIAAALPSGRPATLVAEIAAPGTPRGAEATVLIAVATVGGLAGFGVHRISRGGRPA